MSKSNRVKQHEEGGKQQDSVNFKFINNQRNKKRHEESTHYFF